FLRWVYIEYELSFDPIKIKVPKSPKKNVHIYSDSEVRYIFSLVRTSIPWMTARNKAILALMLDSGLRQCEVCGLRSVDVDIERYIMKVTGKGSKDRMVPLGRMSLQLMNDYLNMCPFKDSDYVFVDRHGSFLSGNAVRLFVYHLERKLPFKFSSHKLRHNFATNYCIDHVRETGKSDVYDLSILMGHESIETTKKYEHFAHEIIASENNISHLDNVYKVI
ncbi:MAG: tyrosine-type recombinase/integrase, partial [Clostridium sp.]